MNHYNQKLLTREKQAELEAKMELNGESRNPESERIEIEILQN